MKKLTGVIAGIALIAAGLGVGAFALHDQLAPQQIVRDLAGNAVTPETLAGVDPSAVHQRGDARLVIPSVNLDVPLGETGTVDGIVNPPGFTSAYALRDVGTADGTTFVVMHSLRNGGVGPGNALFDVVEGRVILEPGSVIELDGIAYRVTGTTIVPKSELAGRADVWHDQPGRLVLITCLQNPGNTASTANAIVMAERVQTP